MATLVTALDTSFTSTQSNFCVQVTGSGAVLLQRRATAGDSWATAGDISAGSTVDVDNRVTSQLWRLATLVGTPTVKAYDAA